MSNPIALVTGGSRGIGRAISIALAQNGYSVAINFARNRDAAAEVKKQIIDNGGRAELFAGDISSSTDRTNLVESIMKTFGQIDLLVNNAGISSPGRADLLDATEESFDTVIGTNLKGPFFLSQTVAKLMIAQNKKSKTARRIINIGSISTYATSINRGDYCIAKAGLGMMTQLFAARLAEEGINVYEIRPGVIETDMTGPVKAKYDALIANGLTPIARWGQPEDVAKAVIAIATDMLPFSTGEVINVDGGFHMRRL